MYWWEESDVYKGRPSWSYGQGCEHRVKRGVSERLRTKAKKMATHVAEAPSNAPGL